MPVIFDEVQATVEPPEPAPANATAQPAPPAELDPQQVKALMKRLDSRALRLRAD